MGALGQFLERFYEPGTKLRSVRAVISHAVLPWPKGAKKRERPIGKRDPNAEQTTEPNESLSVWLSPPDKARVEIRRFRDSREELTLKLVNGDEEWQIEGEGKVLSGPRGHRGRSLGIPTEIQRHFDPSLIRECLTALTLEEIGLETIAGQDCVRMRAIPVEGKQLWPHWLPHGAHEYHICADLERSAFLAIDAFAGGKLFESYHVQEAYFDEPIDETVFGYVLDGKRPITPAEPSRRNIGFEEASKLCTFKVFRPTVLVEKGAIHSVFYRPPGIRQNRDSLRLHCMIDPADRTLWITMGGDQENRRRELLWEPIEVNGQQLQISDPAPEQGLSILALEKEGTWIQIFSDLSRDEMIEIALSFEPVHS